MQQKDFMLRREVGNPAARTTALFLPTVIKATREAQDLTVASAGFVFFLCGV